MKIRMKTTITGLVYDQPASVGAILDVPSDEGVRMCELGYAEPVAEKASDKAEKAVAPKAETRSGNVMKTTDK